MNNDKDIVTFDDCNGKQRRFEFEVEERSNDNLYCL